MSKEDAKKFVERVKSDSDFRTSLAEAKDDSARAKIAKDAGYDFTRAEVEPLLPSADAGDLSDDDLEAVSGGGDGGKAQKTLRRFDQESRSRLRR